MLNIDDKLTHEYRHVIGEVKINANPGGNFSEIKNIIIDQKLDLIRMLSIYPNGFIIYIEQTSIDSVFRTNYPLKENKDGSYDVIF